MLDYAEQTGSGIVILVCSFLLGFWDFRILFLRFLFETPKVLCNGGLLV